MCDFKPGDEVVCVDAIGAPELKEGGTYTVLFSCEGGVVLIEAEPPEDYAGFLARRFRKVERRNDRLSIEAFLTIKPGFEEPKREPTNPAKPKERV